MPRDETMKVLVVEDSPALRETVGTALLRSGFAVDRAADGEEGLWCAQDGHYDAVVLDIMLPKRDGLSVLRALRARGEECHVLLLTARDAVEDRVAGLNAGADDYLVKPFELAELVARVQALCRRQYRRKDPVLRIGDVAIDTVGRSVTCAGTPLDLAPREYGVLEYLARRPGEVVARSEIEAHIYDADSEVMSNVVDTVICALRRKLAAAGGGAPIRTRRGQGYQLDGGVSDTTA